MSNPNTQSAVYDVMPEGYPQANAEVDAPETQPTPKKKKNWGARLFAIILIALCVVPVLMPVKMIQGASVKGLSFLDAVKDLFSGDKQKLFGVLPTYADTATVMGKIVGCAFYATLAMLAVSALIALVTIFCSKKAPSMLRVATFFYTFGMALQVITTFLVAYGADKAITIDIIGLALLGASGLIYFVLAVAKNGKTAWMNTLTAILTAGTAFAVALAIMQDKDAFNKGLESLSLAKYADMVVAGIFGVFALSMLIATIRMQTKKGLGFDLVLYIVQFIVGVAVCYLVIASKTEKTLMLALAIASAVVALLQIIICILRKKTVKKANAPESESEEVATEQAPAVAKMTKTEKKAEKQAKKDAKKARKEEKKMARRNKKAKTAEVPAPVVAQPAVQEFVREEYAEAMPYEGGPVEGVAVAEEVNPTFIPSSEPPQVQTAGYDFYNCKSFDPFIATLDTAQRNQFTEIFILKYSGTMPEIPDYEVGGDNKEFFRKLFIYLGQYRDRIPDGLLAKIYQFAIKLN